MERCSMFITRTFLAFAKSATRHVLAACLIEATIYLADSLIALCVAFVIPVVLSLSSNQPFTEILLLFSAIAALLVLRFFLARTKAETANEGSVLIKENLRCRLLGKLFELGPAFTAHERTGDIVDTISNKVESLSKYYTYYFPVCIGVLINSTVLLAVLLTIDTAVSLVCVTSFLCMYACPIAFFRLFWARGSEEWKAHSEYYADCLDSVQGIMTLKAFNASRLRAQYIYEKGELLRLKIMSHLAVSMAEEGLFELFLRLGMALSVIVSVLRFSEGLFTSDALVLALFLSGAFFSPLMGLGTAWHIGCRGVGASGAIDRLLRAKTIPALPVSEAQLSRAPFDKESIDLRFQDVVFAYEDSRHVLQGVSFTVPSGTMTALVGSSGSGKSTIAHLLAGFYQVETGIVSVGGTPISESTLAEIQQRIGAVWQDSHIFYGTIAENIAIGRPDAAQEEIAEAARNANLHEFIKSLPDAYDTQIGENGARLSGGERQRLSLARVFLRNAPVIIFDEATSSLDRRNELDIQNSFEQLRRGKTAFVIAHRVATIQGADQICLIDCGRVIASGSHRKLMDSSERYRQIMDASYDEGSAR